jgi:hypothetical protein
MFDRDAASSCTSGRKVQKLIVPAIFTCQGYKKIKQLFGSSSKARQVKPFRSGEGGRPLRRKILATLLLEIVISSFFNSP